MLHIYKGIDNNIIFTGLELATLADPKYLFVFTSTNEKIIKFVGTDISTDDRYQKVLILKKVFDKQEAGTWRYKVYEQESSTNTKESLSGGIVEEGFMYLHECASDSSVDYTCNNNEFKSYNCEQ